MFDGFVPTDTGRWVSENFERLAQAVQDYDPQFELRWIPPEYRETAEERKNPYVIVDILTNSPVFYAGELDTPEDILTRLFNSDNKHGDVLERMNARNAAVRALELLKKSDEIEERKERVAFLMKTKKNFINMGNGRVLDDQLRPIREGRG